MTNIILASTSPFRKEILNKLQIPFTTCAPNIDEQAKKNESPHELVQRLSIEKAQACAKQSDNTLIIGSDQVAVIDNEIVGKPHNHENAIKQLRNASGKEVTFLTGLCLFNSNTEKYQADVIPFTVVFRKLTTKQIENYLNKEQPYNSAGSFKSEGLGICLFEKLIGDDPNTLIGLPLIRLTKMFEQENFLIL
ncbi:Maf-like protein YceF [hydrothermal vent metagenome]|uniref:Maf-like protein YceF n=1 Tax=hydrothermal vent metagenome TaxID=652676 RepID=A0A3B0ZWV2_9ZZZZ